MNFLFSYDIQDQGKNTDDRRRISLAFARCGWESCGDTHWIYPPMTHAGASNDDFFNKVLPAFMYFRSLVSERKLKVVKYNLAIDSKSIFSEDASVGFPIVPAMELDLELPAPSPSQTKLSVDRFRKFLADAEQSLN